MFDMNIKDVDMLGYVDYLLMKCGRLDAYKYSVSTIKRRLGRFEEYTLNRYKIMSDEFKFEYNLKALNSRYREIVRAYNELDVPYVLYTFDEYMKKKNRSISIDTLLK